MSDENTQLDIKNNLQLDIKRNEIMEALREVYDPELGMNVVELGLIRQIEINDKSCRIEMILTTPFCPYAPEMLREVRQAAEIAAGQRVRHVADHVYPIHYFYDGPPGQFRLPLGFFMSSGCCIFHLQGNHIKPFYFHFSSTLENSSP